MPQEETTIPRQPYLKLRKIERIKKIKNNFNETPLQCYIGCNGVFYEENNYIHTLCLSDVYIYL